MTVFVNPLTAPAVAGSPFTVSGTVFPVTDSVQVGLSESGTTPPAEYTQIGASRDGLWSITFTPNFSGNAFAWVQQVTPLVPKATLSVSRDRGYSFGDPRTLSLGGQGQRKTVLAFWRLGMARDAVFRLRWSSPSRTSLNGAFIEVEPSQT